MVKRLCGISAVTFESLRWRGRKGASRVEGFSEDEHSRLVSDGWGRAEDRVSTRSVSYK